MRKVRGAWAQGRAEEEPGDTEQSCSGALLQRGSTSARVQREKHHLPAQHPSALLPPAPHGHSEEQLLQAEE